MSLECDHIKSVTYQTLTSAFSHVPKYLVDDFGYWLVHRLDINHKQQILILDSDTVVDAFKVFCVNNKLNYEVSFQTDYVDINN